MGDNFSMNTSTKNGRGDQNGNIIPIHWFDCGIYGDIPIRKTAV